MARSVIIVSTSDQAAQLRINAAYVGTAIAEYFREQGKTVILMMDSVTRFARAFREIGLAAGEPPARAGFTPSVFATLAAPSRAIRKFRKRLYDRLLYHPRRRR